MGEAQTQDMGHFSPFRASDHCYTAAQRARHAAQRARHPAQRARLHVPFAPRIWSSICANIAFMRALFHQFL